MLIGSDVLDLLVLPEVGGKVAQIRDRSSGYEWLIRPQRPYRTLQPDTRWVEYDTSGMDDCFPNVDECLYPSEPWRGAALPQLGEWVYGTWEVVKHRTDCVALRRSGKALPYRALKDISVEGRLIEVRYRVENLADTPLQYLWSAHPLIAAGAEFQLFLETAGTPFVTYPPDGNVYHWPKYGNVDLSREWIAHGRTLKIFVLGLKAGSCLLQLGGGKVDFRFDLQSAPVLGVWFNNFGFPGDGRTPFRCIAVEPCTSASDVFSPADPLIPPRSQRDWAMRIEFH